MSEKGEETITNTIPKRLAEVDKKERRFYVVVDAGIKLELEKEAYQRGSDAWTLGGAVISAWILSGCPEIFPEPSSGPMLDKSEVKN